MTINIPPFRLLPKTPIGAGTEYISAWSSREFLGTEKHADGPGITHPVEQAEGTRQLCLVESMLDKLSGCISRGDASFENG